MKILVLDDACILKMSRLKLISRRLSICPKI